MKAFQSTVVEEVTKIVEIVLSQHQNSSLRFVSLNYENEFRIAEG